MPDPYAIRAAQAEDLKGLSILLADSFHSCQGWSRWFCCWQKLVRWSIYEDLKQRWRFGSPYYQCWIAQKGKREGRVSIPGLRSKRLVGTVEVSLRSGWSCLTQYPYISNLAVNAEDRGQGIAQELLEHCEQTALTWGCSEIYLHVLENNHPARCLYYKVGYRLQQVELHWMALLLGKPKRLFLQKRL
ncbi:GNAT family N-acetyltransferase [Roseofilum casamattae]|uniref:GNAT family N-acetyltransferase n=1 Tax=Roseofilum casamattae BLCC-M143 TaxID=3022442 RepID=A0ABT7BT02_9CYAN|nr:GNAT family N-acetyltransferase [Roseofilum casamattae]MDJ1182313.1 GNAT family N-acetyltransferase [Roseofilum casamattae BLCC-M143]